MLTNPTMKSFLYRLQLAYRLLRARRFVLFLPNYPAMSLSVRGNISALTWEAICHFSMVEHAAAIAAAEARLLADLEAARREAIETEIRAILHP